MKENTIILKAKGKLIDNEAREMLRILETKVDTINERTKSHTLDIRKLNKAVKKQ